MEPQAEQIDPEGQVKQERDLRAYATGTMSRLVLGGLVVALLLGNVLIWTLYGSGAARMSLMCMGVVLLPALMIAAVLWFMGWLVRRERGE